MPRLRVKKEVGDRPTSSSEAIVDQLDDEVFGSPPNLITGFLTGLVGAVGGSLSLPIYFYFREPDHYISPEWLIFVALGVIIGFFLRIEQPLYREYYRRKTQTLRQTKNTGADITIYSNFGRKVDLDR